MIPFDFSRARELMVEQQVRPWDVLEPRVLDVLARVPREDFVLPEHRALAYADLALPIARGGGEGESMLKPVLAGRVLQSLKVRPGEDVLEIGTGSGYLTACLAALGRDVVSIERHASLADAARARLASARIGNAQVLHEDARTFASDRRFDVVCVTGAVAELPPAWLRWLEPTGRLFVVQGRAPAMQACVVQADGRSEVLFETDLPYLAGFAPVPVFEL